MKKTLKKSRISFLLLFISCFVSITMSAFLPSSSMNPYAESTEKDVETKVKSICQYENIDFKDQLHLIDLTRTTYSPLYYHQNDSMIDCPEDLVLNVDNFSCTASGELPLPTNIEGLCGGNEFHSETTDGGTLSVMGSLENGDLSVFAQNLAPGTHLIQYMVNDSCNNVFECEFEVVVHPKVTIIALDENVVVALNSTSTGEAMAIVYPENIDNGSNNPCVPIKLEIRKDVDLCGVAGNSTYNADGHPNDGDSDPNSEYYDPDDGLSIKFCCEDLTNAIYDIDGDGNNDVGYMKVWMRVWDDGDMDGLFGTAGDNYKEAWTFVKVVDQLSPTIACPSDITLACNEDYNNLSITASAIAYGICGELEVEYTDMDVNLNDCNIGFITRRWNVVGRSDIFCDQTIIMDDLDVPVTVSFSDVADFSIPSCPDMMMIGEPTWVAGPCDVIGYTTDTDTFYFEDGACLKIINHYTVINWCDYNPSDSLWNGEGIWEHTQVIKAIEKTQPTLANCQDSLYAVNDYNDMDNDGNVCETMITLTNLATDPESENCPSGWLKWQVVIDLWGDGTSDLEYSSFLPASDNEFDDTNGNGILDVYLEPTNSGDEVNIQLPDIEGGISNHRVIWKVVDGCNNVRNCSVDFMIKDLAPPNVVCQDTFTVGIAQNWQSRLWANKYIPETMDNCSSMQDLRYTFSSTPPEDDPLYDSDRKSSSYEFYYFYNTIIQLPIYIWDENGNFTICETVFIIDPSLVLDTEETIGAQTNALYQNEPNPFRLSTSISFNLHRAAAVKLTFINAVSSKAIEIEIAGKKGLNTYTIDRDLLSGKGLYYYTMTTKYYQETKKMILVH